MIYAEAKNDNDDDDLRMHLHKLRQPTVHVQLTVGERPRSFSAVAAADVIDCNRCHLFLLPHFFAVKFQRETAAAAKQQYAFDQHKSRHGLWSSKRKKINWNFQQIKQEKNMSMKNFHSNSNLVRGKITSTGNI